MVFTQFGRSVESNVTPAHGRISCIATGILLDCTWVNGGARGRETLIKQSDGTLKGTFGSGSSTTSS